MIAIVNVTKDFAQNLHQYEVRINDAVLATFDHYPDEGLEMCLLIAAAAIRRLNAKENESQKCC